MLTKSQSNTEVLEFNPENAPAGMVSIHNHVLLRNNHHAPSVFGSDIRSYKTEAQRNLNNMVSQNSEKIDLIDIMNNFSRTAPAKSEHLTANIAKISHLDYNFINVEKIEDKLCTLLMDRFAAKNVMHTARTAIDSSNRPSSWPTLPYAKNKRVLYVKKEKPDSLTGLDAQLHAAMQNTANQNTQNIKTFDGTTPPPGSTMRHFLPSEAHMDCEIKQFESENSFTQLSWAEKRHIIKPPPLQEVFRYPAHAVRQLISDRLFLLDNHCMELNLGKRGRNGGSSTVDTNVRAGSSSSSSSSNNNNVDVTTTTAPSYISNVSSKSKLLQQATDRLDVSSIIASMSETQATPENIESIKNQALECTLARHTDAVIDAVIESVFQHCAPIASEQAHQNDQLSAQFTASNKRKYDVNEEASQTQREVLFSWEDILRSVRGQVGGNQHNPPGVASHRDLPRLHLNSTVLERTERRLRALYSGQGDCRTTRSVPAIFDYTNITSASRQTTTAAAAAGSVESGTHSTETSLKRLKIKKEPTVKKEYSHERQLRKHLRSLRKKSKKNAASAASAESAAVPTVDRIGGTLKAPKVLKAVWDK